jgi:hypothetical protein
MYYPSVLTFLCIILCGALGNLIPAYLSNITLHHYFPEICAKPLDSAKNTVLYFLIALLPGYLDSSFARYPLLQESLTSSLQYGFRDSLCIPFCESPSS